MQPQLILIDDAIRLNELGGYLADKDFVAFDIETTGLTSRHEVIGFSVCAEEDKAYYVILSQWQDGKLKSNDLNDAAVRILNILKTKSLICHNGVFDCAMIESYFKIRLIDSLHTDTMVLAHLLNENRRVGLKELAKEYFGVDSVKEAEEMKASVAANGGSLTKANYEMFKADGALMGKYGAKDAWLTYKLFYILVQDLYDQELDKFFYEDESMPLLKGPTYDLNTTGLQVDTKRLAALKKQLEAECLEAKAFVYQEIANYIKDKPKFNVGSSSQLAWLLFGKLELEFSTLTKEGKKVCKQVYGKLPYTFTAKRDFIELCLQSVGNIYQLEGKVNGKTVRAKKVKEPWSYIACDKATLKKLAPKHKWVDRLLEYQRKMKILSTYVEGLEERVQYGVIHPSFLQHGTTSGRYSSRNPNFQNLPRDDKRIKECIIARPNKAFVGADYSQLEPRVFAYTSQDKSLMEAFRGTDDFYSVIGMRVYAKYDCTPHKEGSPNAFGIKYKKLRDLSKVIALASTYGATAHQLAPTTGKSIDDTAQDIATYFEQFPDVAKMMQDSHKMAKRDGQVTNLFGRPRRIPEAKRIEKLYGPLDHAELPYEARQLLNLAVNHRIQSTGASIVNRAAIAFFRNVKFAGIDCKIVCQVHDSLVVECNEADAENVALLLQDAMENTTILEGISLEAVPKIGKNLAEV
jgi:DNA polymerase I